jgi:hypothetical protein
LGLALLAIWPAVDEYAAESSARAELAEELAEARHSVGQLRQLEATAARGRQELARLQSLTVAESRLDEFRGRVVELARTSGCQIRKIQLGQQRQQPWKPGDNPLQSSVRGPNNNLEQGLVLSTCELAVSVSGPQAATQQFLARLAALGMLMHPRQFAASAVEGQEKEVVLELSLWLFDLERRTAPQA